MPISGPRFYEHVSFPLATGSCLLGTQPPCCEEAQAAPGEAHGEKPTGSTSLQPSQKCVPHAS